MSIARFSPDMQLRKYQKDAVDTLLAQTKKLLGKDGERICVFKAPTGSGKTIMVADYFKQLASERLPREYAFIWISSHDLHTQSKEKLENYLRDSSYTFSFLEEIHDGSFQASEIVFVNWHSLTRKDREGKWSNVFMRENESDRNLPAFVQKTKREGREIILIVDESHSHYWSLQSQELVHDVIGPKLTLEVSATPTIEPEAADVATGNAGYVVVPYDDVVNDGMIKADIVINKEIGQYKDLRNSVDEAVIDASIAKQQELQGLYAQEGSVVRPLVLIQLPSESQSTSALDRSKLEAVEQYLADTHSITVDNGKLAIWLSERKENLDGISDNNNGVEVLIFKQAIALGWDCPRAQVLVMFREIQSPTFEIQTVGRILRMPETRHYDTAEINTAFVYTNLGEIHIREDDESQRFFNVHASHRDAVYQNIDLPSVYLGRIDYGDLTLSFRRLFFDEANKRFGITTDDLGDAAHKKAEKGLEFDVVKLQTPVIADAVLHSIDGAQDVVGDLVAFSVPEVDLKYRFELFAKVMSLPFAPVRSHTKIQQAIYDWFDNFLGYRGRSRADIQRVVVCSEKNQLVLSGIIEAARARFRTLKQEEQARKDRKKEYIWNVPVVDYYNEQHEKFAVANNVMSPCYPKKQRSNPERDFERMLRDSDKISWWYKNRESKESYFAMPYTHPDDGLEHAFYPDYIVQMKDGSIGIYDTKSGFTLSSSETAAKSDALQKYIKANKSKNLTGGIVVIDHGDALVYTKVGFNLNLKDGGWQRLAL